jgi:multidrug resistance efflux pump
LRAILETKSQRTTKSRNKKGWTTSKKAARFVRSQAERNLGWTRITAPVDGYISNLQIGRGSYARAGAPLISLIDVSKAGLIGYFRENQLGNVALGDPVLIALDIFPGRIFRGRVVGLGGGIATLAVAGVWWAAFPSLRNINRFEDLETKEEQ